MEIKTTNSIQIRLKNLEGELGEMEYRHKRWVTVESIFKEIRACQKDKASSSGILHNLVIKLKEVVE